MISFVVAGIDESAGVVSLVVEASASYPDDFIQLPTRVVIEATVSVTPMAEDCDSLAYNALSLRQSPSTSTMMDTG